MHIIEEKREELCTEICDFRDRLLEKFGEEEVYTSLLWISSLMFFKSKELYFRVPLELFFGFKISNSFSQNLKRDGLILKAFEISPIL